MTIENGSVKKSSLFDLAKMRRSGFKAGDLLAVDPNLHSKFMVHLSRAVRRDEITKNMIFLAGLSAYTKNPINVFMRGPSSIGKSYNTTQVLKYFPQEDVWMLGHRNINNTLRYTQLIKTEDDDFTSKVAKTVEEACSLVEAGYEYVTEFRDQGIKIFRRRK